ncbi:MAG: hypothetical protein WC285_02400 [Candidatus Gracilibacteria bacterium]|jgi:hypothetical protein
MTDPQTEAKRLGPNKISFPILLLKVLAGVAGGGIGALVLLVVSVLAATIISPLTNPAEITEDISPVFVFVVSIMAFLSSMVADVLSVLFLTLTEREKYTKTPTAIYHIFILNVVLFILMVPVYFIAVNTRIELSIFIVSLHVILSTQASALILETVSNNKYTLLGLYGVTFSIVISTALLFGLYGGTSPAIVLFTALPVVWGTIAFVYGVFSMIYGWIVDIYDKDFLSLEINYGNDYGKAVESEAAPIPRAKDEAGADFLRHN